MKDSLRTEAEEPARTAPVIPRRRRAVLRGLGALGALLLSIALLALAGALALRSPQALGSLASGLAAAKPYLVALHVVLIALLWWRWGMVIAWLFRRGRVQARHVKPLLGMRRRVVVLLVVLEVVVVIRPWEWLASA